MVTRSPRIESTWPVNSSRYCGSSRSTAGTRGRSERRGGPGGGGGLVMARGSVPAGASARHRSRCPAVRPMGGYRSERGGPDVLDSTLDGTAGHAPPDGGWHPASVARALVTSIGSVVRGHDDVVELVVAAVLAGGHVLIEDVPGQRQDDPGPCSRPQPRWHVRPDPGHLRPAAGRRHRVGGVEPAAVRLRRGRGSAVRQRGARRRAQPGLAAHPVGPARGDGRVGRDRRRPALPAARPVHPGGHPEPAGPARHLPAARGTAGPVRGRAHPRPARARATSGSSCRSS